MESRRLPNALLSHTRMRHLLSIVQGILIVIYHWIYRGHNIVRSPAPSWLSCKQCRWASHRGSRKAVLPLVCRLTTC